MKSFLFELLILFSDAVMCIPIAAIRNLYVRCVCQSFDRTSQVSRHVHLIAPYRINIGKGVFINRDVTLDGRCGLNIGDYCDIGAGVSIFSMEHDPDSPVHAVRGGLVTIEDHCWIAPHSIILPGIIVKRGTVVGVGSVLTHNTDENSVVAGVPAKIIRKRNNDLLYKIRYKIVL